MTTFEEILQAEANINRQRIVNWIIFAALFAITLFGVWWHLPLTSILPGVGTVGAVYMVYLSGYRAGLRKGRQIYRE